MRSVSSQHYFLLALLLGVALLSFKIVQPFFAPLVLAAVFAVVLQPMYQSLVRFSGRRESLAALSTVAVSILIVLLPIVLISFQLLKEAQTVYSAIGPDKQQVFSDWIQVQGPKIDAYVPGGSASLTELSSSINVYAREATSWLVSNIGTAFSSFATLVLEVFIFFVTLYYLLRDGKRLKEFLVHLSPLKAEDDTFIVNKLAASVNAVVKGKLAIAVIQGVLAGIGLWIFGVPNPVLWGLAAMITSLIPPVGVALVTVPAVVYLLIVGSIPAAIGLGLWSMAVGVVDNILGPRLMGSGMDLHPLLVLLSVLGGLAFFGPVGLFLGPLVFAMLLTLLPLYSFIIGATERGSSVE